MISTMPPKNTATNGMPPGVEPAAPDARGNRRFLIRYKTPAGMDRRRVVVAPDKWEAARERERRIAEGAADEASESALRSGRALGDLVPEFLATRQTVSTGIQDRSNLRRLTETFGDRTVASVTPRELQAWLDTLRPIKGSAKRYDAKSLAAFRRSCRAFWGWARRRGFASENVAKLVEVPEAPRPAGRAPSPDKRHLTIPELRTLFAALDDVAPDFAIFFRTQLRLGLRVGEVCALQHDAVNWKTGAVLIDGAITHGALGPGKSAASSMRYLTAAGRADLKLRMKQIPPVDGYVFTKADLRSHASPFYQEKRPQRVMVKVLDSLGGLGLASGTRTHALRHSWEQLFESYTQGLGPQAIASILGNRAETAARHYMQGPGILAQAVAEHLEEVVFG